MHKRLIYFYTYPVPPRAGHRLGLHQLRDTEAFTYLREAFLEADIPSRYCGVIRNVAEGGPGPELTPASVVAVTSRLPLDDRINEDWRPIPESGEPLEVAIFSVACRFFNYLHRGEAHLSRAATQHLQPTDRHLASATFHHRCGARMLNRGANLGPEMGHRTLTYLLNLPGVLPGGATLLWSFGLCGEAGLLWNRLVMTRYSALLRSPRFAVAEIDALTSFGGGVCGPTMLDGINVHPRIVLEVAADTILAAPKDPRPRGGEYTREAI